MPQDFAQTWNFVAALAGDPNAAVIDWRAIHDVDKSAEAVPFRGTLNDCWSTICQYNDAGYGIFAVIAAMDGVGRKLENVWYIRAHYVDLDEIDAQQQYERAAASMPSPAFAVASSPGKFHVYWPVQPYQGNHRFEALQRKLRQYFNADNIIDPTRVMRVPGTMHLKNPASPHSVVMWALGGAGYAGTVEALETAYAAVNVIDGGDHVRQPLGDPELAAPSLEWLQRALDLVDPNTLDRYNWVAMMCAVKQAGWTLADDAALFAMFSAWCARYGANDPGENVKQWNSIRNTELGWKSLVRRVPSLEAMLTFGSQAKVAPGPGVDLHAASPGPVAVPVASAPVDPSPPPLDCSGEYLTHLEQREWFRNCTFIVNQGLIFDRDARFLNQTKFNAKYGGKKFIVDGESKTTDEPWKAATRSTLWTIPKVDHVRFLPDREFGDLITDDLGRVGVNTYKPAVIQRATGDAAPFLNHLRALIPDEGDRKILLDFLAHNIKYPGYKIPWMFVIQSAEGAGKGVLKALMRHAMGQPYVYFPNATELTSGGSKFNAWLASKLFILVDEIKVDDRADLLEVLKPIISEDLIEVQSKGVDQDLADNFANWGSFTNFKTSVPVSKNGRRYAVFFSPLQSAQDMLAIGMDEKYFSAMYGWLKHGGAAIVTDWFMNYPIERGAIPMRAPKTTSWEEAVNLSRSPVERAICEGIEDQMPGFRGGWISNLAVLKHLRVTGATKAPVQPATVASVLESMGYVMCGKAPRAYFAEDAERRADLYYLGRAADVAGYGAMQGYE